MKNHRYFLLLSILLFTGCSSIATTPIVTTTPITPLAIKGSETSAATPDLSATEYSIASTAIVEAILSTALPRLYKSYPSPDGKWQAEISIYDCINVDTGIDADANGYEQLQLIEVHGGEKQLVDSQLQNCSGLGAAGLEGLYWSSNSRYFYYTDARDGMPDGGCGYWDKPILRLDVNNLEIEQLGGGPLSPDGTKIVTWQGKELVIRDINEGREVGRLSPYILNADTGTGDIAWSPDSQAFVYVQLESYCQLSGKSQIVHVDVSTLRQMILLESAEPTLARASWDAPDEIKLFDENGKQWIYDLGSKELKSLP